MTTGQSDENQKSEFNRQLSNPAGKASASRRGLVDE